jgi:hypothetical protein
MPGTGTQILHDLPYTWNLKITPKQSRGWLTWGWLFEEILVKGYKTSGEIEE